MGSSKSGFLFVFVVLFHVLVTRGLAGRHGIEGLFWGSRGSSVLASPDIDEGKVEQMWLNCGLNLMAVKEVVKTLDFSPSDEAFHDSIEIKPRTRVLAKSSIQEAISLLSPKVNHSFLDCLNKQNFPFHFSGEDSLRSWLVDYLDSLLDWHPTSRRYLADQPSQNSAPVSSPAPGPTPAHAAAIASAPSPGPGVESPSYGPAPVPAPASSPDPSDVFPGPSPSSFSPQEFDDINQNSTQVAPSKKEDSSNKSVVIAVVVTAAVTSIFVAFIFLCYFRCRGKNYPGGEQRDDRPLLSLSLSNYSGSPQNSFGTGYLTTKFGALSFKTDPSQKGRVSSLDASSVKAQPSEVLSGNSISSTEQSMAPSNALAPPKPPPPPPPPVMAPPFQKASPPPPGPPPPPSKSNPGLRPPPPPKGGALPPRPPQANSSSSRVNQRSSLELRQSGNAASSNELSGEGDTNAPKTKLKPFFWDKVLAKPDHSMVWDHIKAGSFQFNEEMIESLFGYAPDKNKSEGKKESSSKGPSPELVRILDPKKSQNLAISLKAMNVKTDEVCEALMEGNELPTELVQTLLRMAPTTEEELKLRLYSGEPSLLGPGELFLKALLDIPFAFQRLDVLLFMASLPEEVSSTAESFSTLEVACKELRSSRLFFKLLEAVLKTGNRMNDGTFRGGAQAFKLDTLLKLADVKGTDGKTTLLHFVIQEIIQSEGVRAARVARESRSSIPSLNSEDLADDLPSESLDHYRSLGLKVVSGLSSELENVKKAAGLDADALTSTVANLGHRLVKTKEFLKTRMEISEEASQFHHSLRGFVERAEADITSLLKEEKRIRSLVKSTTDYFDGNAGKDEGLRLFVIVRDFLGMVDKVCREVRELPKRVPMTLRTRETPAMSPARDPRQQLFPAIRDRRMDSSSSDEDS